MEMAMEMCKQRPLQTVLGQIIILAHNLDLSRWFWQPAGQKTKRLKVGSDLALDMLAFVFIFRPRHEISACLFTHNVSVCVCVGV